MSDISSTSSTTNSNTTSYTSTPSTSSVNNSSSDIARITGLTGFDVDGTVKKLMTPYQAQIDKVKQQQTIAQWQQDEYRTIIGQVNTFSSNYFDILSPNYILSQNKLSPMTVTSSDTTGSVTATANTDAQTGSYSVGVSQLATKATISGGSLGNAMIPITDTTESDWAGKSFSLNGNNITLDSTLSGTSASDIVQNINKQIATTSLYGQISASYVNDGTNSYIKFVNSGTSSISLTNINAPNDFGSQSFNIATTGSNIDGTNIVSNDWSNANFTLSDGTNSANINLAESSGTSVNQIVSDINTQILGSSLNGKVAAKYVNDGTKDYITFVNTGTSNITLTNDASNPAPDFVNTVFQPSTVIKPSVISSTKLSNIDNNLSGKSLSFNVKYNNTSVTVSLDNSDGSKTISDVMNAINSQTGGNVTASMDDITGSLVLQNKNSGSNSTLSISNDSNNLLADLGLGGQISTTDFDKTVAGKDAIVNITSPNGSSTTMTESSNNFTLNGVSYSLNNTTDPASPVKLNVSMNTQNIVKAVSDFVTQYNTMISAINSKYSEKKQYDYLPLTSTQMASMSATDITNWQNQAHVGILSGDTTLGNLMTNLQNTLFNTTDNSTFGINLTSIGITTSPDITQRGKLVVDTDKLTQAIQNNPNQVVNLLIQQSSAPGTTTYDPNMSAQNRQTRTLNEGIFQRISDVLNDNVTTKTNSQGNPGLLLQIAGMQGTVSEFSNSITKQLTDFNTKISDMTTKMNDKQNQYYKQFSQMEVALQNLNSQSGWLSQMFGGSSSG